MMPGVEPLNGEAVNIALDKDIEVVSAFVRHTLFRKIISWKGIVPSSFQPIEFFSRRIEDDLICNMVPEKYRDQIAYRKGIALETRVLYPDGKPIYLIMFKIFYQWDMQLTCSYLIDKNIDLRGRLACCSEKLNDVLAPQRNLVGQIKEVIDSATLIIERGNETHTYRADELFLENNRENRRMVLSQILGGETATKIMNQLFSTAHMRKSHKYLFEEIRRIHSVFCKDQISNGNGVEFRVGSLFKEGDNFWNGKKFSKPTYIFSTDSTKTNANANYGIKLYGPWDKDVYTPKKPLICAFCRKVNRAAVASFLAKFRNGIPSNRQHGRKYGGIEPYNDGFVKRYHLSGLDFAIYDVDEPTPEKFSEAISKAIGEKGQIHLAIVETSESFRDLPPTEDPYYLTKSKLLQNQIPSQEIKIENIRAPEWQLGWILNSMSLAIYAKLGGTPWVTPVNQSIDHELVIGLGYSNIRADRFAEAYRVVGFTTIFSGDGTYLVGNRSRVVEYNDYLQALIDNLKLTIDEVRKKYNWQKGSSVRLVFHVFKPFRHDEIDAIQEVATHFGGEHEVSFAYLTVSQEQPFLLVDLDQGGEPDRMSRNEMKGVWSASRGEGLRLDDLNSLIQLTGPREIKKYTQGGSYPVLVKLHERSTFRDIDYEMVDFS